MEDKNKGLIEYKKNSIIFRVINFFKSILFKNKILIQDESESTIIEEKKQVENEEISLSKEVIDFNKIEYDMDKNKFFKTYNEFKNNRVKINDIGLYDIIRINKMIEEERLFYINKK